MTEKPPLPNQQIKSSADRENWETEFHRNYIAPQIRNITETAANYLMKLNAALAKNQRNNVIEGEINQTLIMDKQYLVLLRLLNFSDYMQEFRHPNQNL